MKRFLFAISLVTVVGAGSSCAVGYQAPPGFIWHNTTLNHYVADKTDLGSRRGTACVNSFFALFSTGDAGVEAAASLGSIQVVKGIDFSETRLFWFFWAQTCTTAYGD